jgi:hypothetical protein
LGVEVAACPNAAAADALWRDSESTQSGDDGRSGWAAPDVREAAESSRFRCRPPRRRFPWRRSRQHVQEARFHQKLSLGVAILRGQRNNLTNFLVGVGGSASRSPAAWADMRKASRAAAIALTNGRADIGRLPYLSKKTRAFSALRSVSDLRPASFLRRRRWRSAAVKAFLPIGGPPKWPAYFMTTDSRDTIAWQPSSV